MLHLNSRYDAFGTKTGETGTVDNKYLFAGEQYDSNLGDYYLRARYYDSDSGRFTRLDTYEGRLDEPLTLHKYLYAYNNPVNLIDPTGLTPTDDGDWVHEEISKDFLRGGRFRRADTAIREIWEYEGINPATVPTSLVWSNRRNARPDLVDFHSSFFLADAGEVYEIGTVKALPSKLFKISNQYLPDINRGLTSAGRNPRYTYGIAYTVLPPILRNPLTGKTAIVFPPIGGVISYVILPNGTSREFNSILIDTFSWAALAASLLAAAARASRTLGLA